MIDKELVIRKINLIQEDLEQLQKYKRTAREDIEKDIALEAAIERYLERMITRAIELNQHLIAESEMRDIKIPKDYKGTFMALGDLKICPKEFARSISDSAGFRNILVHEYDDLDKEKFYLSLQAALEQYPEYCKYIIEHIGKI